MLPFSVALPTYYRGDTWQGLSVDSIKLEGVNPPVALKSARMQFRTRRGELGFEYNSTQDPICKGLITIVAPVTWTLIIEPHILPLEKGVWLWDLELTAMDDVVITFLKGRLRVKADITYR